jgi:hypothetical protein
LEDLGRLILSELSFASAETIIGREAGRGRGTHLLALGIAAVLGEVTLTLIRLRHHLLLGLLGGAHHCRV